MLKEALAGDKPAYDFDKEVAERMAALGYASQEERNIDRAVECDISEEPREAEE